MIITCIAHAMFLLETDSGHSIIACTSYATTNAKVGVPCLGATATTHQT